MKQGSITNPDVAFLVLARPADSLSALVSSILPRHGSATFCHSVYDLMPALQEIGTEQPVIVITRPAMLAKPHLTATLRRYPNLRLIGWLGSEEKISDPAVSTVAASGMVSVSGLDQLCEVIGAICNTLPRERAGDMPEIPKPDARLEPADYRLSSEEINALLGAG